MTYLQPLFPAVLLLSLLLAVRPRRNKASRWPLLLTWLLFFLVSWPPVAMLALKPLESSYTAQPPTDQDVQAIVVLSSAVYPPTPPLPTAILGSDTYERIRYAAWLHQHGFRVPVLATGGGSGHAAPYAVHMKEALVQEGVPTEMVWTEEASLSTYENALNSAPILKAKSVHRIVLVTEAYHMTRARKCFEKQGFTVVPAACGFRAVPEGHLLEFVPGWEAISWNEDALHEAIGLLWYRLTGKV